MKRHAIVLMRWHAMARRGNEEANEGALGRVCHALCMGHHRRRSAPPYRHLNQISVDLNGLRHRPGGQANRREKWVHEAKRGAKYTARVTLGRLSHAPSRALSSPLVDVAVARNIASDLPAQGYRWCMERHAIVSMRWHDMVRRGNEGASTGGVGRESHLPERRLLPRPLNPAVWAYSSCID